MTPRRKSRGEGKPAGVFGFSVAGDRKRKRLAEYPCVSRLRQRRLILFLFSHDFVQTHDAFMGETAVLIDVMHLHRLVLHGQWSDAIKYLSRFLPSDRPLGVHGRALFHFLRVHKAIDDIVAGGKEALSVTAAVTLCLDRFVTRSPALTKLRAIFSSLIESRTLRDSMDLARMRWEASSIVEDLLDQTPEFKDHMRPCRGGSMNPQNVLPLGFGHASFRPRRHVKKQRGKVPASVVAGIYLQKKNMLPSLASSDHSQGLAHEALVKAKEWLVDLVDRSVEAGKPRQGDPVRSACNKGAPGPQASFCTVPRLGGSRIRILTDLVILREAKEWILYLTEERLETWPDASQEYPLQYLSKPGALAARLSQTMPAILTRPAETSVISSVSKAGAPPAPASETIPDTLTMTAGYSAISSVTEAGAPFSHAMFGTLRDAAADSVISSVTNEGSLLWQNISRILTDHAEKSAISFATNSGAPPARVSETIPMPAQYSAISSVTKAGAPFAHAMFGTLRDTAANSLISSVKNEGSLLWQNISGLLTDHAEKSAISFATNSGIAEFTLKLNIAS